MQFKIIGFVWIFRSFFFQHQERRWSFFRKQFLPLNTHVLKLYLTCGNTLPECFRITHPKRRYHLIHTYAYQPLADLFLGVGFMTPQKPCEYHFNFDPPPNGKSVKTPAPFSPLFTTWMYSLKASQKRNKNWQNCRWLTTPKMFA